MNESLGKRVQGGPGDMTDEQQSLQVQLNKKNQNLGVILK